MSMFQKSIHHSQDDTLSMHPRKPLNEVKSYVGPHMRRYLQGLQEAGWSEGVDLVLLTYGARADKITYQPAVMLDEELRTEALQSLLEPLMAC